MGRFAFIGTVLLAAAILSASFTQAGGDEAAAGTDRQPVPMDFAPIPFSRLIGMADLVATGSVEAVGDAGFRFRVDEFLVNEEDLAFLNIAKYAPPEAILSPTTYASGQRFVLFLTRAKSAADQAWNILGIAGEGQMPLEGEYVFIGAYDIDGLEYRSYEVHGATRKLQRYDLGLFRHAVKNYRDCFAWRLVTYIQNEKERTRWVPARTCPLESVSAYRDMSLLHEYLAAETMQKIPTIENR